jgi:hypothetical protein
MPKCEFEKSGAIRVVSVDGSNLSFQDGKASRTLSPGEYSVSWLGRCDAGDAYSVKVVKPTSAAHQVKGKIDAARKDAGTFWVRVSA